MKFSIMTQLESPTDWSIIRLAIHYHEDNYDVDCIARKGLIITLFGFSIFIGRISF